MKKSSYADYIIHDVLSRLEGVTARAMFGGHGLYLEGKIFGIIADEALYFKAGDSNRRDYEVLGSKPFTYETGNGKRVSMSYWEVPAQITEDGDAAAEWARKAASVSVEAKKNSRPPKALLAPKFRARSGGEPKSLLELMRLYQNGFIRGSDLYPEFGITEKQLYKLSKEYEALSKQRRPKPVSNKQA